MHIQNILIVGDYKASIKKDLSKLEQYHILIKKLAHITEDDLNWADAYVGFEPCEQFHPNKVKWVHTFNAGVNNYLEIEGWQTSQTLMTRTVTDFGVKMAEYCLSYILRDTQQHTAFNEQQKNKQWKAISPKPLKDITITLFGTGAIGQKMAEIFSVFGITVHGVSNSGMKKPFFHSVTNVTHSESKIADADYVISTLPLTKSSEYLFNYTLFEKMNNTVFINLGRGKVVDTESLITALNNKHVRHAILDVFESEPLSINSKLWERDDVTITPHISALTDIDDAIACFYETLQKIERGYQLDNKVDFSKGY
ncbi:D-2-hydroxyacid dehydrogenase [Staphylococcus sp. ACRSN]|uniref:D-2-hydroxyacid dehydrogenase n=1 Tax=Staphylococcus sp. ACRSN TaxID=2918214 RepID=UPI001EF1A33F|nr:D-2-hydroxyacid dehydrogenase [Staphylococcus sp. ACRSN]MCG7339515.1 D-2-hydroxyacid dehydrogenase [Staphylococcus sp. ACRSN]